jgi:photosystem II stability/assembly factor-like uncharacterized protein
MWVVGAPSFAAVSIDRGATWSRRIVTGRADVLLNAVLFADAARGWIAGYDAAERTILVFTTDDGGASWREQVLLTNVLILEQQPVAAFAAFDRDSVLLVGTDPNSFALEGSRALSFVSRDGGETWTASLIPGGYQAFADVSLVR